MISVKDLVKNYGDFNAVKGISFDVFENEIFAMVMLAETEKDVTMKFVQDELKNLEDEIAVKIFAQHEDIFNAMHRI